MNDDDTLRLDIDRRQYYASSRGPFQDADNVLTFYGGGGRGAVVDDLVRRRHAGQGTLHVHGESGAGLTFLSLVLADRLERSCNVIRHETTRGSTAMLLRQLLIELCPMEAGLIDVSAATGGADEPTLSNARARVLAQLADAPTGRKPYVLIVDHAGDPDVDFVTLLDALGRVCRGHRAALQVVLFRRAEPAAVREAGLRDTDGRAADGHYWLRRLTLGEVGEYLRHRMTLFDFSRRDLFTREMCYFVAERTEGVLGPIDRLARHAFTLASLEDVERPSMAHLLAVGLPQPVDMSAESRLLARRRRAFVALLGVGVVGSLGMLLHILV